MDLRLVYFIGGFVVVLLLLLVSFVLNARRASRIESVLDEIQEQLHLDSDDRPISGGVGLGGSDAAVDSSQIVVRNAQGEEQPLDEVLADLSAKLDAASRGQQKSYANIMAEQQNLKESLGQLKTLLAGISAVSGTKAQGEEALNGAVNSMAGSVADGVSGGLSAVAGGLAAGAGALAAGVTGVNSLAGAGVTAGAALAAVGRQAERSLSPAAVMAMASSQQGNGGNSLRGATSEPAYIDERLRAEFGDDSGMGASAHRGAQPSYGDPERQADLAFAAVKQHNYQDQGNNGVYLPPGAVPIAAAEGAFMPNADPRVMAARTPRANAQEYANSHFEPAANNNNEAYGGNRGGYGGQSNVTHNAPQGQNHGVNGRDPRNPLGMGSRGVSSPKDNGANAEDEPRVSAYDSEEQLTSTPDTSDSSKSFAAELAAVSTAADPEADDAAVVAFNNLKAESLSTSVPVLEAETEMDTETGAVAAAVAAGADGVDGAKSETALSAAIAQAADAELASPLSPEDAWAAASNGKSDELTLTSANAESWDEAAQVAQALAAADASKHELAVDIPSLLESSDFIPRDNAVESAPVAVSDEAVVSAADGEVAASAASADATEPTNMSSVEDEQTIEMEIAPQGSLFHSLFQAEAFAQSRVPTSSSTSAPTSVLTSVPASTLAATSAPLASTNAVSGLDLVGGIVAHGANAAGGAATAHDALASAASATPDASFDARTVSALSDSTAALASESALESELESELALEIRSVAEPEDVVAEPEHGVVHEESPLYSALSLRDTDDELLLEPVAPPEPSELVAPIESIEPVAPVESAGAAAAITLDLEPARNDEAQLQIITGATVVSNAAGHADSRGLDGNEGSDVFNGSDTFNGSNGRNGLNGSESGGRDADRSFTGLNAPEAEHLAESLEAGTVTAAPAAIEVSLPSAGNGQVSVSVAAAGDAAQTEPALTDTAITTATATAGLSSNLQVEDDDDAGRFDALRALTSNYQQLQQPLDLKVDSNAEGTEDTEGTDAIASTSTASAAASAEDANEFGLEIEPVAAIGAGAGHEDSQRLGAPAALSEGLSAYQEPEGAGVGHDGSQRLGAPASLSGRLRAYQESEEAGAEAPRSLIVDFTTSAPGEFKVKVAHAETDGAGIVLSAEAESTGESERAARAATAKAEVESETDAVAAAIAAQITASPEQARGVQAVGVGAFKHNGGAGAGAANADAANAGEGKSLVVDLFYDDEVYRKHQREKPNGIDFRILDKAHRFLEAGVSLQELSQCTGLSEDELRMLYDVDENDQIKDKDASALVEHIYHENEEAMEAARAAGELDDDYGDADADAASVASARHHDDALASGVAINAGNAVNEFNGGNGGNRDADDNAADDFDESDSLASESSESEEQGALEPKHEAQELAAAIAEGMEGKKRRKHKNGKNGKKRKRRIVADNPTTALDPAEQQEIAAMMQQKEDPFATTSVFAARQASAREAQLSESEDAADTKIIEVDVRGASAQGQGEATHGTSDSEFASAKFAPTDFAVEHEADHLAEVTAAARQRQQAGGAELVVPEGAAATIAAATTPEGTVALESEGSSAHSHANASVNANTNANAAAVGVVAGVATAATIATAGAGGAATVVTAGAGGAAAIGAVGTANAEPELLEAEPINNNKHQLRVRAGVQSYAQVSQPIGLGSVDEEENDIETANAAYQHLTAEADPRYAQGVSNAPRHNGNNMMLPARGGEMVADNAPYMQQMMAGIAEAIEREEDSVTIAGMSITPMPTAPQAVAPANAASMGMVARATTPPVRPHSAAAVQAARDPLSIGGVERVQSHEIAALSNDEELKFSRAHASANAHARSSSKTSNSSSASNSKNKSKGSSSQASAAAQAGDPKALMAGRKRQSTGNGLFSMLSAPLNAAQNLAAQATAAFRGGKGANADSDNKVAHGEGSVSSRERDAERGDHVTLSAVARAAVAASAEGSKGTNLASANAHAGAGSNTGANTGAGAGTAVGADASASANASAAAQAEAEKKSLARHKRDSGVIEVPVPLETMAAGKMTVDMALAQMEHGAEVKLEADEDADDLDFAGRARGNEPMAAPDDEALAQMSAAERLLGMNARQGGQVGETLDAASFGNMREELAYQDLMANANAEAATMGGMGGMGGMSSMGGAMAAGMSAPSGEPLEQGERGEQTLTPEQLETLKNLQNGAMAAMSNPVLARPNNQYMPLRNKAQDKRAREAAAAAEVLGTEPPRHFANLQARNAYNLRQ